MKNTFIALMGLLLALPFMASCEKAYVAGDSEDENEDGDIRVTFNVKGFEQIPFDYNVGGSRAQTDVGKTCTHIDLAVFDGAGKVKGINQKEGDGHFGELSLSVPAGSYEVVIVAHSGTGTATISSPQEIKFKDNKITDTFYYYGEISVTENGSYDVTLRRAVSMFRLVVSDNVPGNVTRMKFYYTGGSSTFNARTGFGSVNSRQTEYREVATAAHSGASRYEVYSFPHIDDDELKIVVSALDADDRAILERTFPEVPISANKITQYTGEFFGAQGSQDGTISLTVDDGWDAIDEYSY